MPFRSSSDQGRRTWAFAEDWKAESGPLCLFNPGEEEANVEIRLMLTDRELVGPFPVRLAGKAVHHVQPHELFGETQMARGDSIGGIVESSHPIYFTYGAPAISA